MNSDKKLITILGPTAVGKTKLAAQLAYRFNAEIISADSRQVYIGMDIGTGKDYEDYFVNKTKIKTHLIDVISPLEEFNLYLFQKLFYEAFNNIIKENKIPFLVGGTALYINSVLKEYELSQVDFNSKREKYLQTLNLSELKNILLKKKEYLHNTTDLLDKERTIKAILIEENKKQVNYKISINPMVIGVYDDREIVKKRIRERLKKRLHSGMIEEVELLLKNGVTHDKLKFFGLEYKLISMYLKNELNYNDMYQKLASAIINFSKCQMTWFRKMEREGIKINWIKNDEINKAEALINTFLK